MQNSSSIHGSPARALPGCAPCGNARQEHGLATCSSATCGSSKQVHRRAIGDFTGTEGEQLMFQQRRQLMRKFVRDMDCCPAVARFIDLIRQQEPKPYISYATSRIDVLAKSCLHPTLRNCIKPITTTGDGNCFYNALSIIFFGDESLSAWFRLAIAQTVHVNEHYFAQLLSHLYPGQSRSLTSIVTNILTLGDWATEFTTLAASALCLRPITMLSDKTLLRGLRYGDNNITELIDNISSDTRYFGSNEIYSVFSGQTSSTIYMMHINNNHFVACTVEEPISLPFRKFQDLINQPVSTWNETSRTHFHTNISQPSGNNFSPGFTERKESMGMADGGSSCRALNHETNPSSPASKTESAPDRTLNTNSRPKSARWLFSDSSDTASSKSSISSSAAARMKKLRSNQEYALKEKEKNRIRKQLERNKSTSTVDSCKSEGKKDNNSFTKSLQNFKKAVSEGPTHVCYICHNLWFRHSVRAVKRCTIIKYGIDLPDGEMSVEVCFTCNENIRKGNLPAHSWLTGKNFPVLPEIITDLNPLEEIFVSPRIPFMTIRPLGCDRQHGLKGAVVNVPIDVPDTLSQLPRRANDSHVVAVQLKRKKQYETAYSHSIIRPSLVLKAAEYLTKRSLYKKHEIPFVSAWNEPGHNQDRDEQGNGDRDVSDVDEEDEPLNPGGQETLLCPSNDLIIAPGEGRVPLNLVYDEDCEELCFPTLFGGEENPFKFMKPGERAKFMARHHDRRCSKIPYLFFVYKRLEMEKLGNIINICVRKRKANQLKARDCLDDDFVSSLCQHDEGYKFMKSIRSSPAYWESKKKDVFAMIRQLGIPTLFMTFSAAESKWFDLLVILKKVVDNEDIDVEIASRMSYGEKSRLIRNDPVTCARYFENKFRHFLHKIVLNQDGPFRDHPVLDYYVRFEFQHRGSVHAHMVVWLEDAPLYDPSSKSSRKSCRDLIDSLITCREQPAMGDLINYQRHKHSFTCRKSKGLSCRFGIPFFPMRKTEILEPLPGENTDRKSNQKWYQKLRQGLTEGSYRSMDEMLEKNSLTYEQYLMIIRSQLRRPKVFLKRDVNECNINAYNSVLLDAFQSNMDIQFVVDAYACVSYIIDYINKSNRGMSVLMRNLVKQLDSQNIGVKSKLQAIASKFINATEVSAQEAAYHILELPLSKGSRQVIYINTARPEERVKLLKCKKDLMALDDESEDVYHHNIVDHYTKRPHELEDLCLADFAANFNVVKSLRDRMTEKLKSKYVALLDRSGFVMRRTKSKIIRYRRYSLETEALDFWREHIMLFTSWRNEYEEILVPDIERKFREKSIIIDHNKSKYHRAVLQDRDHSDSESDQNIQCDDNVFSVYSKPPDLDAQLSNDTSRPTIPFKRTQVINDDFTRMVRQLNVGQYKYALSILDRMDNDIQIFDFLTGGAGTGKSKLIACLAAAIDRYFNVTSCVNEMNSIRCLLCAPTGKAAHNIKGLTLHTAFSLPVSQNKEPFHLLSADKVNTLRCRLYGLKFLIIDEISMVGATLFEQTESRLRQIFDSTLPFGGISVITVGDFTQLRPVCDSFVFEGSKRSPYHALSGCALWNHFKFYELNEIMRQKDDVPFAQALQHYASCEISEDDKELLRARMCDSAPSECIHLYASRAEVDMHNEEALKKLDTFSINSVAADACYGQATDYAKKGFLKSLKTAKASETCGLLTTLQLKVNAKYMITENIDIEDGLVNGAIGTLVFITLDDTQTSAVIAWLEFDEARTGSNARAKYSNTCLKTHPRAVPIFRVKKLLSNKGYHKQLQMYRSQFPVVPAEAITIHKSQGSTFNNVAYHVGRYVTHSSAYVAMSRSTSAAGLYIVGEPRFFTNPSSKVIQELQRLRCKPAANQFDHLIEKAPGVIKIVSFNIQSYSSHIDMVTKDPCLMNADILCFVETWTTRADIIDVENFGVVARIDSGIQRKPSGVLVLSRDGVACELIATHSVVTARSPLQASVIKVRDDYIVVVYIPPKSLRAGVTSLLNYCFDNIPQGAGVVVTGDFNMPSDLLSELLSRIRVRIRQVSPAATSSTYLKTQIDHTFSNTNCVSEYYHSFLSHHKPQVIHILRGMTLRRRKRKTNIRPAKKIIVTRNRISNLLHNILTREQRHCFFVNTNLNHKAKYLRCLLRKRNRHKIMLPQHKLPPSKAVRAKKESGSG